jgi:NTP pyrophosphatase (non-canonical NTP hydrolase)
MIEAEYVAATHKHPKFCDDFTGAREWFIVDELERWRKVNSDAPYHADAILNEEILEALEAYKAGDFEHTLQELAQCGAVILRMMQYVEEERWAHGDTCKKDGE